MVSMKKIANVAFKSSMALMITGCGVKNIAPTKIPTTITGKVDFGMDGVKPMPTTTPTILPEAVVKIEVKEPKQVVAIPTAEPTPSPVATPTAPPIQEQTIAPPPGYGSMEEYLIGSGSISRSIIENISPETIGLFGTYENLKAPIRTDSIENYTLVRRNRGYSMGGSYTYFVFDVMNSGGEKIGQTTEMDRFYGIIDKETGKTLGYSHYPHQTNDALFQGDPYDLSLTKVPYTNIKNYLDIPGYCGPARISYYINDKVIFSKHKSGVGDKDINFDVGLKNVGFLSYGNTEYYRVEGESPFLLYGELKTSKLPIDDYENLQNLLATIKAEDEKEGLTVLRNHTTFEIIKIMDKYENPCESDEFASFLNAEKTVTSLYGLRYNAEAYPYIETINKVLEEARLRNGIPATGNVTVTINPTEIKEPERPITGSSKDPSFQIIARINRLAEEGTIEAFSELLRAGVVGNYYRRESVIGIVNIISQFEARGEDPYNMSEFDPFFNLDLDKDNPNKMTELKTEVMGDLEGMIKGNHELRLTAAAARKEIFKRHEIVPYLFH